MRFEPRQFGSATCVCNKCAHGHNTLSPPSPPPVFYFFYFAGLPPSAANHLGLLKSFSIEINPLQGTCGNKKKDFWTEINWILKIFEVLFLLFVCYAFEDFWIRPHWVGLSWVFRPGEVTFLVDMALVFEREHIILSGWGMPGSVPSRQLFLLSASLPVPLANSPGQPEWSFK